MCILVGLLATSTLLLNKANSWWWPEVSSNFSAPPFCPFRRGWKVFMSSKNHPCECEASPSFIKGASFPLLDQSVFSRHSSLHQAPSTDHLLQCKSPWIQTIHVHRVQPLLLICPVEPVWTPCDCFQLHMCLCTGTWGEPRSALC